MDVHPTKTGIYRYWSIPKWSSLKKLDYTWLYYWLYYWIYYDYTIEYTNNDEPLFRSPRPFTSAFAASSAAQSCGSPSCAARSSGVRPAQSGARRRGGCSSMAWFQAGNMWWKCGEYGWKIWKHLGKWWETARKMGGTCRKMDDFMMWVPGFYYLWS